MYLRNFSSKYNYRVNLWGKNMNSIYLFRKLIYLEEYLFGKLIKMRLKYLLNTPDHPVRLQTNQSNPNYYNSNKNLSKLNFISFQNRPVSSETIENTFLYIFSSISSSTKSLYLGIMFKSNHKSPFRINLCVFHHLYHIQNLKHQMHIMCIIIIIPCINLIDFNKTVALQFND